MEKSLLYDKVKLLEEAKRYKTAKGFLEILYNNFNDSQNLFSIGLGPRILTINSSLTKRLFGCDNSEGSISRARQFANSWEDYISEEPFNIEFEFLAEKGITPRFENFGFYLGEVDAIKQGITYGFDGIVASELLLHLAPNQVKQTMSFAKDRLNENGKYIFTVYPSGREESLDKYFGRLAETVFKIKSKEIVDNGIININKLGSIKNVPFYDQVSEKYWLDLFQIRVYDESTIEQIAEEVGLQVSSKELIKGGMFSFADRFVYTLSKS